MAVSNSAPVSFRVKACIMSDGKHTAEERRVKEDNTSTTYNPDGSSHHTSYVDTPAGSIRASYDEDMGGNFSNAHFSNNDKKK
jgi:hypothetical protein